MGHGIILCLMSFRIRGGGNRAEDDQKGARFFCGDNSVDCDLCPAGVGGNGRAITLREIAKIRLQNLSFFIMVLLVSAVLIRWVWNSLARILRGCRT